MTKAVRTIRIAAGLIDDAAGRILLVRKAGSAWFMQPGGKIEAGETPLAALRRELREEIGLEPGLESGIVPPLYLGRFTAPAANEPGWVVAAEVFHLRIDHAPAARAEIEEAVWVLPAAAAALRLAPLTRDCLLPLTAGLRAPG